MKNETELAKLLMEIGYLAASRGLADPANTIFDGVAALRPDISGPILGRALAEIGRKQYDRAEEILRGEGLERFPDSEPLRSLLGLTLHLQGRQAESEKILQDIVEQNRDPQAVQMARELLPAAS